MRSLVPLSVCPGPGARPRKGTVRVIETGRAGSPNLRFWDQLLLGKISESDYSERTLGPEVHRGLRGRDRKYEHKVGAVVRDPGEPQVVS